MNDMDIIMEGAKPEIDRVLRIIAFELFLAYCQSRQPNLRPTTELAKQKDIAPSWKAWWNK